MYNDTLSIVDLFRTIQRLENKIDTLTKLIQKGDQKNVGPWLTVEELQKYLPSHPSKSTIHRWTSNGVIPFSKSGKKLCFQKSEIDSWMEDRFVKSQTEITMEANRFCGNTAMHKMAPWRIEQRT